MTYKEFKKHFQDRAINEYGFKRIGTRVYYSNEEVLVVFDIVKSGYSNSLSRFEIGVNPLDLSKRKLEIIEKITADASELGARLVDKVYIELDEIHDFKEYDEIFEYFFKNEFPKWLSISSIKEMIRSGEIYALDYLKKFWDLK